MRPPSTEPEIENEESAPPGTPGLVRVERGKAVLRVEFPFEEPVAAVAFWRGRTPWLLFDTEQPLDLKAISSAIGDELVTVEEEDLEPGRLLRLSLPRPSLAYFAHRSAIHAPRSFPILAACIG